MLEIANTQANPGPQVRKAKDYWVEAVVQPGEVHRSIHHTMLDYRLQEITDNGARGFGTAPGFAADKPAFSSPWHYHDCELQLGVVMEGSVELGFQENGFARAGKGDIIFIPGQVVHDVSGPSADYRLVEFTFPGSFATIEAEAPEPGAPSEARIWGVGAAMRARTARGLVAYAYPVHAPYRQGLRLERERRSRVDRFQPAAIRHRDRLELLFVIQGSRTIAIGQDEFTLVPDDVLVAPVGAISRDIAVSDDYEGLWIYRL